MNTALSILRRHLSTPTLKLRRILRPVARSELVAAATAPPQLCQPFLNRYVPHQLNIAFFFALWAAAQMTAAQAAVYNTVCTQPHLIRRPTLGLVSE